MTIRGQYFKISQLISLALYYGLARWFPRSGIFFNVGGSFRYVLCRHIFKKCGKNVNVERGAFFGKGVEIEIGDYSGIGLNANIPGDTIIGDYVMMAPNCHIFNRNHNYSDIDKPMMFQGESERKRTIISDDVWIAENVIILPGRIISKGSIIGAGCVLTKDYPEYSVVGGNPSRLIKVRK